MRQSFIWSDLEEVRNQRQAFGKGFFVGGALASAMTVTKGRLPGGARPTEPDAEQPLLRSGRAESYPAPDGQLTFDKLSSVFLSGNKTRDDQPNHIRIAEPVPRDVAELWVHMCPAQVYEVGDETLGRDGDREDGAVELRPVRRHHREGRPPHAARGRLGPRVPAHVDAPALAVTVSARSRHPSERRPALWSSHRGGRWGSPGSDA